MPVLLLLMLLPMTAPDLKSDLRDLAAAAKDKDAETVIDLLNGLATDFDGLDEKQQKSVIRGIEGVFKARKDIDEDVDRMCIAGAAALSAMGRPGEQGLLKCMKIKYVKNRASVLAVMVEALAVQQNPAMIREIVPYLDRGAASLRGEAAVVGAAARSLAYYHRAPGKDRKAAVKQLVQVYVQYNRIYEKLDEDDPDEEIEIGFNQVEMPLLRALSALTGEQFEDPDEWQTWWTANKNEDWEDLP